MSPRRKLDRTSVEFCGTEMTEVSRFTFLDGPAHLAACPHCGRAVEYALRDVRFPNLEWGSACVRCPDCHLGVPVTIAPYGAIR
jgi:hypothetical protein